LITTVVVPVTASDVVVVVLVEDVDDVEELEVGVVPISKNFLIMALSSDVAGSKMSAPP
jgi:hypothetical protein